MKRISLAAAFMATALAATSALAADLPNMKAPPYIPPLPPLWTGFYVGLNAGGTWSEHNHVDVGSVVFQPGVPSEVGALATGTVPVGNNGGFIGGGQIGYIYHFANSFVAGIEADIQGLAQSSNAGPPRQLD